MMIWSLTMADLTNDKFVKKMPPVNYMIDDNQITDSFPPGSASNLLII